MRHSTAVFLLVSALAVGGAFAQNPSRPRYKIPHVVELNSFDDKRKAMDELIKKQTPRLQQLYLKVEANEKRLMPISDILKYPKNINQYRDTSIKVLTEIRIINDEVSEEMRELHFDWLPYTMYLMAVYTRYGELMAVNKADEPLKQFIVAYRKLFELNTSISAKLRDIYNECDYLINAKLN